MSISKLLSYLFHPIFTPIIIFIIAVQKIDNINFLVSEYVYFIYIIVFIFTISTPLLITNFLIKLSRASSLENDKHNPFQKQIFIIDLFMALCFWMLFLFLFSSYEFIIDKILILDSWSFLGTFILLITLMISCVLFYINRLYSKENPFLFKIIKIACFPFSRKIVPTQSLFMLEKEERIYPLFWTSIVMIFGYDFFQQITLFIPIFKQIYVSLTITVILSFLITIRWKISLHMIGIGASTGIFISLNYLYGDMYYLSLIFLFFSGLLGYSRMKENAHTHSQIYLGFILGCLLNIFLITY